jgi:hypothetical protein
MQRPNSITHVVCFLATVALAVTVGMVGCKHRKVAAHPAVEPHLAAAAPLLPSLPPVAPAVLAAQAAPAADTGFEVLTRGPLHEAFAEVIAYEPQPGIIVPREPPALVEELPPDARPVGDNVLWIPGYWAWDEDLDDFIWVSGVWRTSPEGCRWVSGYWTPVDDGWQWVSGYWFLEQAPAVEYVPAPPASLEVGPTTVSPGPDYLWTPGCWQYVSRRYVWRPGHWMVARPNLVWVPGHYVWTPRGHIYLSGYWDYPFHTRGVIFAPIRFHHPHVPHGPRPIIVHRPTIVIQTSVITVCLFSRPQYRCYYFGDYFDRRFSERGIRPWFDRRDRDRWYDPVLAYERRTHERTDPQWERRLRTQYDDRRVHADARPPRTWQAQEQDRLRPPPDRTRPVPTIARRLEAVAADAAAPVRMMPVRPEQRRQFTQQAETHRQHSEARRQVEAPRPSGTMSRPPMPNRTERPTTPGGPRPGASEVTRPQTRPSPEVWPPRMPDRSDSPRRSDAPQPVRPPRPTTESPRPPRDDPPFRRPR